MSEYVGGEGGPVPAEDPRDAQIRDFRTLHSAVLLDRGHPDHSRRSAELKAFYERRYAEAPQPQYDPVEGATRPANDLDQVAEEAMTPPSPTASCNEIVVPKIGRATHRSVWNAVRR